MTRRNQDPDFDRDEIEDDDPLGEQAFAEAGFEDAPGGGGQKVAGIPEARQHETNTPSEQRPDTTMGVIKERGGEGKGDPAVGGTRPD